MNFIRKYLFLLAAFFVGCSESPSIEGIGDGKVEVSIGGSYATTTRSAIGDDLESAEWVAGDQISVWAEGDSGFALSAECFELRYYGSSYSVADFWATISPMAEGEYTYYGVYPYTTIYDNSAKTATLTLLATQSGEYDGVNDIMVAEPLVAQQELTSSALGSDALQFSHLTHILRLEVPDGRNDFGMDLTGIDISFSQDVVGDVTVDYSDPTAATVLTSGSSDVSVVFDEPFETGDGKYIWVFMHPTTLSGEVTFRGKGASGNKTQTKVTTAISGEFAAGAITPIKLTIPEASVITTLQVKIPHADVKTRIGETLQSVTVTVPSGFLINDESNSMEFEAELYGDDIYELYFYDLTDEQIATLNSSSLTVKLDTKSVEKSITSISISGMTVGGTKLIDDVDVPYFLKTSFENITSSGSASTTGESHTTSISGTGDNSGWLGSTRATWTAGSYVTVRPYYFGSGLTGKYTSKISSCTLSNFGLKSTASNVSLYVSYTATWTKNYHGSVTVTVGGTDGGSINDGMYSSVDAITFSSAGTQTVTNAEISGLSSSSRVGWLGSGTYGSSNYSTSKYETINIDDVTITLVEE